MADSDVNFHYTIVLFYFHTAKTRIRVMRFAEVVEIGMKLLIELYQDYLTRNIAESFFINNLTDHKHLKKLGHVSKLVYEYSIKLK